MILAAVLVATQLRALVAAGWLGSAVELGLGLRAGVQVLTRAFTVELAGLLIAALALWAAGGRHRDLGRAFDLACVAVLPLVIVELAATVVVRALELAVPAPVSMALAGVSYAWAGALVALALGPARRRATAVPAPPPPVVGRGRIAGWAVVAVVAVGVVVQVAWIARHVELMRPMTDGEPAPAFALPRIGANGVRGEPLRLDALRGRVVVLDFWATWCNPCIKAMPKLAAIAAKHPDEVAVVAINLDDAEEAAALWAQHHYTFHLLADDGEVSQRYGVTNVPHTVLLDREGRVRLVVRGNAAGLERAVHELVAR